MTVNLEQEQMHKSKRKSSYGNETDDERVIDRSRHIHRCKNMICIDNRETDCVQILFTVPFPLDNTPTHSPSTKHKNKTKKQSSQLIAPAHTVIALSRDDFIGQMSENKFLMIIYSACGSRSLPSHMLNKTKEPTLYKSKRSDQKEKKQPNALQ